MKNIFDKNTILGILLIAIMTVGYMWYTKNKLNKLAQEETTRKAFDTAQTVSNDTAQVAQTTPQSDSTKAQVVAPAQVSGADLELKNNLISIQVNTAGAQMHNAILKDHRSYFNQPVVLLPKKQTEWNWIVGNQATKNIVFSPTAQTDSSILLTSGSGIQVKYTLVPNTYQIRQEWTWPQNVGKVKLESKTQVPQQEVNLERERLYSTVYYMLQSEDHEESLNKNKNEELLVEEPMKWFSYGDQFFNTSLVPTSGITKGNFKSFYQEVDTGYVKNYQALVEIPSSNQLTVNYFVGPTSYKLLKKQGSELENIVPLSPSFVLFRWMKIFNIYLIIPIFDFLSKYIASYGIIILVMTLFIKLITAPLSYKTYKSGVAMKILKPDLDKLRAKYGDDQQGYAQAQMKLFNQSGVSPLGGCLPMLLQMPILFAMFNFFPSSIELRHQPFLWCQDLSTYDSILNLPFTIPFYGNHVSGFALLMSISQIFTSWYSQKLQPSSPQQDQMKMMTYLMPIIFLFMFNSFPAALTFYYLCQNVLSVIQQWVFTTYIIDENTVRKEIAETQKKPVKPGKIQQKMQEIMNQAEEQKKMQQKNKTK